MSYLVRYKIEGDDREHEAGPYDLYVDASEHYRDIRGYERVHSAYVIPTPDGWTPKKTPEKSDEREKT